MACSYWATKVVDEFHFNKQRFYILYKEFMKHNHVLDVKEVNAREVFYLPAILNHYKEFFTTFGIYSLTGKPIYILIINF